MKNFVILLFSICVLYLPVHAVSTISQQIGQHLIIGINQYPISATTLAFMNDYKISGVIFTSTAYAHADQVKSSIATLKRHIQHPLFFGIDQEGGRVSRIKKGVTQLPSAARLSSLNPKDVKALYTQQAKSLAKIGINLNFSPVADVQANPENKVIGSRSFSTDPQTVSQMCKLAVESYLHAGILPVVKHFPGHGYTQADSHKTLPVHYNIEHFNSHDIKPFRDLIKQNIPAIMVNHVKYPFIDADSPASLSHAISTELLQKKLAFNGLVFTDDLAMGAIRQHRSLKHAIRDAILAGNHQLIVIKSHDKLKNIIDSLSIDTKRSETFHTHLLNNIKTIKQKKRYLWKNYAFKQSSLKTLKSG